MAKRVEPWNPNTADWLVAQRGKRTQDQVVADMAARGVALKRAWLSRIENGAPFSADLLAAFETYYKSVAPPFESADPIDDPSLAAALSELAKELRATREERAMFEARLRTLESAVGSLLAPQDAATSQERSTHPETAGSGR